DLVGAEDRCGARLAVGAEDLLPAMPAQADILAAPASVGTARNIRLTAQGAADQAREQVDIVRVPRRELLVRSQLNLGGGEQLVGDNPGHLLGYLQFGG